MKEREVFEALRVRQAQERGDVVPKTSAPPLLRYNETLLAVRDTRPHQARGQCCWLDAHWGPPHHRSWHRHACRYSNHTHYHPGHAHRHSIHTHDHPEVAATQAFFLFIFLKRDSFMPCVTMASPASLFLAKYIWYRYDFKLSVAEVFFAVMIALSEYIFVFSYSRSFF